MAQGLVAYAGLVNPKGCVYTQSLGVYPDRITVFATPQATAISARGDITLSYDGTSIVLPNCYLDDVTVVADVADGHRLALTFLDRREIWTLSDTISREFNVWRAGTQVEWRKKHLREIVEMLLQYIGEATPDVSALPDTVYPEVRWDDIHPVKALDELLAEWGFSLSLGFGSENVKIVQLGTGNTLSITDAMMISSTVDPKTRPRWIRVRFGPSLMQARIKLEAVGLDTDDTWKPIDDLSYKPTGGWETEDPVTFPKVKAAATEDAYNRCVASVYKVFRIKSFPNGTDAGTLDLPDSSGTLTTINQILPLQARLLDSESIRVENDELSQIPFRVYGKRQFQYNTGEPAKFMNSAIDDEIIGEPMKLDGENGILIFQNPQTFVESEQRKPADLYLECTFTVTSLTDFYPIRYKKDISLDPSGIGYRTIPYKDLEERIVMQYGANHAVTGSTDNDTDLDALAALIADAVAVQYTTSGSQMVIYCQPQFGIRCDGAIHQVRHIICDGTRYAASFTSASRNVEFDRQVMTRDERQAIRNSLSRLFEARAEAMLPRRRSRTDD